MTTADGRPTLSRADIHAQYGYPIGTLERWWRNRAANGHPAAVPADGRALRWDAEEWAAWDRRRLNPPAPPAHLRTREQLAAEHRLSLSRLDLLWANRAANGHPAAVPADGRALRWDAEEWARWYPLYLQAEPRWFRATEPADSSGGDPDELIGPAEFARVIGHRTPEWVNRAAKAGERPPGFPAPATWDILPTRRRPKWRRRDAETYAEYRRTAPPPARPGRPKGARATSAPYAGDPRLHLAQTMLAQYPDEPTTRIIERLQHKWSKPTSYSSWVKIITAARTHPET
ncbi:hypothetical protein ACIOEX_28635 [Streptomyces sp. NPDC087850]|uniref:hypothetical protein n=1 Tax=Streptomyces sp. NPDC087850 TaxID=3365809 RepID=UPI0037F805D7